MFKVPKKTSIYKKEVKSEKYTINFAKELVKFILEKRKVKTFRFGPQKDYLNMGDVVRIRDNGTKKIVCEAKIISKKLTTFKKLPLKTPGHEVYRNKGHQRKVFSGYYAYIGREIRDDDPFIIFEFRLQE